MFNIINGLYPMKKWKLMLLLMFWLPALPATKLTILLCKIPQKIKKNNPQILKRDRITWEPPWAICSRAHDNDCNGTSAAQTYHHYHLTLKVLSINPSILKIKWFLSPVKVQHLLWLALPPCPMTWTLSSCPWNPPSLLQEGHKSEVWYSWTCAPPLGDRSTASRMHWLTLCLGGWQTCWGRTNRWCWMGSQNIAGEQKWRSQWQGRGRWHLQRGLQWWAIANAWSSHPGNAIATVRTQQAVCASSQFHISTVQVNNSQPFYQRGATKWRINLQLLHSNLEFKMIGFHHNDWLLTRNWWIK